MTAALVVLVIACAIGAVTLHWHGVVADEQRAEAERLRQWETDLQAYDDRILARHRRLIERRESRPDRRTR